MMKKILNIKRIFIIGIISLVSIGIMLSSNWNYFIRNNANNNTALNSYQISSKNSFTDNYNEEVHSIVFQINILKSAIKRNNFMYKSYSKVFAHNISYIKNQKNSTKNRISIANSSIKHEIDILSSMNNIILNHPYNYLKFFQSKNYTLPEIVSQSNRNVSSSLDSIETYTSATNKLNPTVSNISYQSEEAVIGIGSISSLITGAKTLIFSKVNYNYNNIYYFSTYTDNLTTLNQFKNTYTSSNSQNIVKNNQFIENNNTNSSNQTNNNLTFSILHNNVIDYIKNKPYVVAAPLGGLLTLIIGGVVTGVIIHKYRKRVKAKLETNRQEEEATNIIVSDNEHEPLSTKIDKESQPLENQDTLLKDHSQPLENQGGQLESRVQSLENKNKQLKGRVQPLEERASSIIREYTSPESHYINPDRILNELIRIVSSRPTKIKNDLQVLQLTNDSLKTQLLNYFQLKRMNKSDINKSINEDNENSIKSYIMQILDEKVTLSSNVTRSDYPYAKLIQDTIMNNRGLMVTPGTKRTQNGWFEIPNLREFNNFQLTKNEKEILLQHKINFEDMLEILSNSDSEMEISELLSLNGEMNVLQLNDAVNKVIAKQVLNDFKQLVRIHRDRLSIESLQVKNGSYPSRGYSSYTYDFASNTVLIDRKLNDTSHLGLTDANIAQYLSDAEKALMGV